MEVLFIMSSLFCGHQKPLMKPLMKSLIKSLLFAVWWATHEPLMKPLQGFFSTHEATHGFSLGHS